MGLNSFDRLIPHRTRRNIRRRRGAVLIMDAPQGGVSESWRHSQARWRNTSYNDPWPDR